MLYKILCFVPGDHSTMLVNIDEQSWVAELKNKIKEMAPATLNGIDAHRLTLYRVEVDRTYDMQQCIDEFKRLSGNLNECTKLNDVEKELSVFFGESPPEGKKYYILVQLPEGKSIHCGGIVLMADVAVQMQPTTSENDRSNRKSPF